EEKERVQALLMIQASVSPSYTCPWSEWINNEEFERLLKNINIKHRLSAAEGAMGKKLSSFSIYFKNSSCIFLQNP
ncbi:MAG: hypothetical protein ACUVTL_08995, partial [Thermoproteota archaeon]